jgi:hypothetical protein
MRFDTNKEHHKIHTVKVLRPKGTFDAVCGLSSVQKEQLYRELILYRIQ